MLHLQSICWWYLYPLVIQRKNAKKKIIAFAIGCWWWIWEQALSAFSFFCLLRAQVNFPEFVNLKSFKICGGSSQKFTIFGYLTGCAKHGQKLKTNVKLLSYVLVFPLFTLKSCQNNNFLGDSSFLPQNITNTDTLCFVKHLDDHDQHLSKTSKLWCTGSLLMFYDLFLSKKLWFQLKTGIAERERLTRIVNFHWIFLIHNFWRGIWFTSILYSFCFSFCCAPCITDISFTTKQKAKNAQFSFGFEFWLKRKKEKKYGWQKSCSEISDVKNDRERYCHFGAVRAPRWLITANFFLYYTFTFYHFTGDNFHFSSLSISLVLPLTTFTFNSIFLLFYQW